MVIKWYILSLKVIFCIAAQRERQIPFVELLFMVTVFLGPHLRHMEIPRLGVQSEL